MADVQSPRTRRAPSSIDLTAADPRAKEQAASAQGRTDAAFVLAPGEDQQFQHIVGGQLYATTIPTFPTLELETSMHWLFGLIADRLRALFVADVALDLEAQAVAREADRKAGLLRQAAGFRDEGLEDLADELEQRASQVDLRQPLAGVLPAVEHWQQEITEQPALGLTNGRHRLPAPARKKKARRKPR